MRYLRSIAVVAVFTMVVAACGSDATVDTGGATQADVESQESTTPQSSSGDVSSTSAPVATDAGVSYPIVGTGQEACYDATGDVIVCPESGEDLFGQDGTYAGSEASYVDNGDGTVTDLVTGLMWQQDPGAKMTYAEAASLADSFSLAGYDDWRLPSIKELYSLIDFSGTDPSGCTTSDDCAATPFIDSIFAFEYGDTDVGERVIDSQWATSTVYVSETMGGDPTMFGVNFADGRIKGYPISDPRGGEKEFFVVFVRGAESYGVNDFVDNGDGTISDRATSLVWQQADSGVGMDWPSALEYCEALELGDSVEWRLPDAKELQSIVDYTRSPATDGTAAIDPLFNATAIIDEGGAENFGFYWSGTTHASLRNGAASVYVAFGDALGWMEDQRTGEYVLLDVHGAGAQRSDPKVGDASDYPLGNGPQGDVVRIDNLVRCVSDGDVVVSSGTFDDTAVVSGAGAPPSGNTPGAGGPLAEAAAQLGVSEDALVAALGPPGSTPPDLAAAAAELGVTEDQLRAVLPPPTG